MKETEVEQLSLALVSAYVWVASADEGVDVTEYTKFQHLVVESPFATQFDVEELQHSFKAMVNLFETDYDKGIELTRDRIRAYADDDMKKEEIIRFCRGAVVADAAIKPSEETVLAEITKELS